MSDQNEVVEEEEEEIKAILLGEISTGKTSLINTAIGLKFEEKVESTTTNSITNKTMKINNKTYSINLWDTIGQEKYRSLTKIFIKGAKIVIFVYDITNYDSFKELNYWFESTKDVISHKAVKGLVGNKNDLYLKEEVKEEEAKKLAKEKGMEFALTSAKDPRLFCEFLEKLIRKYLGEEVNDEDEENRKKNKKEKLKLGDKQKGKKKCS